MTHHKDSASASRGTGNKRVLMACTECRKRKIKVSQYVHSTRYTGLTVPQCNIDPSGTARPCERCSRKGNQCRYEPIGSTQGEGPFGNDGSIQLHYPYANGPPVDSATLHLPLSSQQVGTYNPNQHTPPNNTPAFNNSPAGHPHPSITNQVHPRGYGHPSGYLYYAPGHTSNSSSSGYPSNPTLTFPEFARRSHFSQ